MLAFNSFFLWKKISGFIRENCSILYLKKVEETENVDLGFVSFLLEKVRYEGVM